MLPSIGRPRGRTLTARTSSLLALAAVALSVGGCGGSDTTTSSPRFPQVVPQSQFVRQAKVICRDATKKLSRGISAFYERRARETGEPGGAVGSVEAIPEVVVPLLRHELGELEAIGLPKNHVYEAEALWQTLKTVLHETEVEGIYAWRSAKLLPPFRNRAKPFGLQHCVIN